MKKDNTAQRRIDEIGRVLIPSEFRKKHDLTEGSTVNITSCEDGTLVISKAVPSCSFCGGEQDLIAYRSKYICKKCLSELLVLS